MPKAIVTQAQVFEIANRLTATSSDPSILNVQAEIGGGSYSTIKRYLDEWKAVRSAQPPAEIATKGSEFVRSLWAAAATLADQRATQVREDAQRQVAEAQAALATAEAAIARLEAEGEEQTQRLTSQEQTIAALRDELAQARSAANSAEARAAEQAQRVDDLRRELELAHQQIARLTEELQQAHTTALDHARLTGELAALKQQLQDQATMIQRLTGAA